MLFALGIKLGQFIPCNGGVHIMHDVEIVVQKQQGQRAAVLDDDGTGAKGLVGAVFQKGADLQKCHAQIDCHKIAPQRHPGPNKPKDDRNQADQVHAGGGRDLVMGMGGIDTLYGEGGIDLIDGGKGQLSAARETLEAMGIEDVTLIGIAKGPHHGREGREVFHFMDGREKMLPVNSPVLFHLQRLRDEVHRFAIGAHRAKRSRAITASPLDEVPGIGPARKRALLLHFGTAGKVRAASLEDLQRAPGVSAAVAQAVYDFYHQGT